MENGESNEHIMRHLKLVADSLGLAILFRDLLTQAGFIRLPRLCLLRCSITGRWF